MSLLLALRIYISDKTHKDVNEITVFVHLNTADKGKKGEIIVVA